MNNPHLTVRLLRPKPAPLKPPASELKLLGEGVDAIIQLTRSPDRYWFDPILRFVLPWFLHRDVVLPSVEDRQKRYADALSLFANANDRQGFEYRELIGTQFRQAWRAGQTPTLRHIPAQMPRAQRPRLKLVRA